MESGTNLSGTTEKLTHKTLAGGVEGAERRQRPDVDKMHGGQAVQQVDVGERIGELPARVRATVVVRRGEYDASRLRSQRDVIRDVMVAATDCDTWLTLGELRALTRYGEASISAQLRHLRKTENGGYDVAKRRRDDVAPARAAADGRGECTWEYRIVRALQTEGRATSSARRELAAIS
jgi:hypothetical protein